MTRAHLISFLSLAFLLPFLTGCASKPATTRTALVSTSGAAKPLANKVVSISTGELAVNAVKPIEGKQSGDDSLVKTAKISGEGEYSSEYATCVQKADDAEPGSNGYIIAAKDCVYEEGQHWDKRLNTAYKAIMAEPTYIRQDSQKTALRNSERAWIKHRDSEDDGLATRLEEASCILDMTIQKDKRIRSPTENADSQASRSGWHQENFFTALALVVP